MFYLAILVVFAMWQMLCFVYFTLRDLLLTETGDQFY